MANKERKKKIVVADDDSENREFLKLLLEDKYDVILAKDGSELLDLVNRENPDLIVTDIMMPGIDGLRAVDRLRKTSRNPLVPAIFISAIIKDKKLYESLKPEGPTDFILKPFKSEVLLESIENFLGKQEPEDNNKD